MAYSLYLGTGAVGQIEIFSALCLNLQNQGAPLEEATRTAYQTIKQVSQEILGENKVEPFWGYGTPETQEEYDEFFETFHPFSLYKKYARIMLPTLEVPLICIEPDPQRSSKFKEVITSLGITNIQQRQMKLNISDREDIEYLHNQEYAHLPSVSGLIEEQGYPSVISGAHLITTIPLKHTSRYDESEYKKCIPHHSLTRLMDDDTLVAFLEEGDLVKREGIRYISQLNPEEVGSKKLREKIKEAKKRKKVYKKRGIHGFRNLSGLEYFEDLARHMFHLADEKKRKFSVRIYPKDYMSIPNLDEMDSCQLLFTAQVKK